MTGTKSPPSRCYGLSEEVPAALLQANPEAGFWVVSTLAVWDKKQL
jgi:hypothetical protein